MNPDRPDKANKLLFLYSSPLEGGDKGEGDNVGTGFIPVRNIGGYYAQNPHCR